MKQCDERVLSVPFPREGGGRWGCVAKREEGTVRMLVTEQDGPGSVCVGGRVASRGCATGDRGSRGCCRWGRWGERRGRQRMMWERKRGGLGAVKRAGRFVQEAGESAAVQFLHSIVPT